jgi:hypothetical protein
MRTTNRKSYSRKHLANPKIDLIYLAILMGFILLAHFMRLVGNF